jgi:hypothetical protein
VIHKLKVGELVILNELPKSFLDGLPGVDQGAILGIIGKPIKLAGYEGDGRAELEFTDREGVTHFIYVSPDLLRTAR